MQRPVKLRFTGWQKTYDPDMKQEVKQIEAHFARKGHFYGIVAIRRCTTSHEAYHLVMLFPGGQWDFMDLLNPVPTMKQARANARAVVETFIEHMQGIVLA